MTLACGRLTVALWFGPIDWLRRGVVLRLLLVFFLLLFYRLQFLLAFVQNLAGALLNVLADFVRVDVDVDVVVSRLGLARIDLEPIQVVTDAAERDQDRGQEGEQIP